MAKVRKRVTEGRFSSRGGRRHRRRKKALASESTDPRLVLPDAVEQSLLTLDATRDFRAEPETKKGWSDVVFGWFKRSPSSSSDAANASQALDGDEDPVREILSHPRGPARLDAFQRTLEHLVAGTQGHRGVAIAFHRELVGLAENAQVDLALLKSRVEACAKGLMAASEHEVAGMLLARIGRRHQAAEMFVAAGAIEALEKAHAEIEMNEGGDRLSARLCYERFEGLFLVGFRQEAMAALQEACSLWPENPVYAEILDRFERRLPARDGVLFQAGGHAVLLRRKWPLTIGRDDRAALTLKSPLVSRQHLEVANAFEGVGHVDDATRGVRLLPIEVPAETDVNGVPLSRALDLRPGDGVIDIRGVVIHYRLTSDGLLLWAQHGGGAKLFAPLTTTFTIEVGDARLPLEIDDRDHLVLPMRADMRLSGETLRRSTLLLCDDKVQLPPGDDGGATRQTVDVHRPS